MVPAAWGPFHRNWLKPREFTEGFSRDGEHALGNEEEVEGSVLRYVLSTFVLVKRKEFGLGWGEETKAGPP